MINIEPTNDHQVPYDTHAQKLDTFQDELTVTANTVDLLEGLGMPVESSPEELEQTKRLLNAAIKEHKTLPLSNPNVAFGAREFLKNYANQLAMDAHQVRSAITTKLMEIANCGDPKFELKALELLGKHSDIGLFTERSEITINYKSSTDLENAIKERVKRLLNADVVDITPISDNLDEELGVVNVGDFVEEELPNDDTSPRDTE
jgi:hypothetical protein